MDPVELFNPHVSTLAYDEITDFRLVDGHKPNKASDFPVASLQKSASGRLPLHTEALRSQCDCRLSQWGDGA